MGIERWDSDGRRLAPPALSLGLSANVSVGTSLSPVFSQELTPGFYIFECELYATTQGPVTGITVTPGFTGTADTGYRVRRYTATAQATALHASFQQSASSLWLEATVKGRLQVTATGLLTIGCTRTGGTNVLIQVGSSLTVTEVD